MAAPDRSRAEACDSADPLAAWRARFVTPDVVYLDGNSLGMAPVEVADRIADVLHHEWATDLIRSWDHWADLPSRVGDRLAPVLGASTGTVVVHDSTTVNLYQATHAAIGLAAAGRPRDQMVIGVDPADFPTDRYVAAGIAAATGARVAPIDDPAGWADVDVAVRSLVDYRTAACVDLSAETATARASGTVIVWDLSHAAGAVEVDVVAAGVDLAVGCSYKYLNGGPGAPGWTYVRPGLGSELDQPIWGWFAQRDQFEMGDRFDPHPDARRFLLGTPGVLGLVAAEVGIGITADAGMATVAAKGRALTSLALDMADELGLASPTPRDPAGRGAHVAIVVAPERLDDAHRALLERAVVVDKRRPDLLRVGCSPLTTRYVDVHDGVLSIAAVLHDLTAHPSA